MRRWLHWLLRRPGIQRHTVDFDALVNDALAAAERDVDVARAALLPDTLPFVWPAHDPDYEWCECRDCHRIELARFADDTIRREFDDIVRTELSDVRIRVRWKS
jgi:hypothetical protein